MEPMMISVHYEKVCIQYEKETLCMFSNRVGANTFHDRAAIIKKSRDHIFEVSSWVWKYLLD